MRKTNILVALAMTIGIVSCSDDPCTHNVPIIDNGDIKGAWYEEAENEEMRFNENGTFYDRYANYSRCAEVEGRWEYDKENRKLTYSYPFMGQMQFADWTVRNLTDFGFTISSTTVADHNLEKIVESYTVKVGEIANIAFPKVYPDQTVLSYSSKNERIASVSPDGVIKAEGEKGITYVKVSTRTVNVWVKVTVGDNCSDLWHDYVGLMGLDYAHMKAALSRLGDPYSGEDGYSFGFVHQVHDVLDITKVFLCPEDGLVTEIQALLKDSVPEAEILSYLNSRYYKLGESGTYYFYSSVEDQEASKAIIAFDKFKKCVTFNETQHFLHYPHVKDLWADFVSLFGYDKAQVGKAMEEYGYSFLMSDYSYSKDGSDYYAIMDNEYLQMVGFVFNPDKHVSEFWLYMDIKSDPNDVYDYLCAKYNENEQESAQYSLVFYNDDKSLKVVFDLKSGAVVYTNLLLKQHEADNDILGRYHEGLGMTKEQLIDSFGTPYSDDGEVMFYIVGTQYVDLVMFSLDAETGKCTRSALVINENVSNSIVIDYFNSKYSVFANGTYADGSQYAWIDGPSVSESTLGILFYPADKMVMYQPLGSAASKSAGITMNSIIERDEMFLNQVEARTSTFFNDIINQRGLNINSRIQPSRHGCNK